MITSIEELNRLHAATTQGEWGASTPLRSRGEHVYVNRDVMVADCCRNAPREQCESNAAWIAVTHNAWPEIAAEIQRLREENARLTTEVEEWKLAVREERNGGAEESVRLMRELGCVNEYLGNALAEIDRLRSRVAELETDPRLSMENRDA